MKHTFGRLIVSTLLVGASLMPVYAATQFPTGSEERLSRAIRKELVTMPFLSIFDNLTYRIDGDTIHLNGQVIRPTLKSQAERLVARLEGVAKVQNHIEVLPLSPFDDRIRLAVARAIYGQPALSRYGLGANPSIRIIVKRGDVTLEGVVDDRGARDIAFLQANGVSGVFSVTNNLRVSR